MMEKPPNPYPPGTIIWSVYEGDWADLTICQIAEVLDCRGHLVENYLARIKRDTGYVVPRTPGRRGRCSEI